MGKAREKRLKKAKESKQFNIENSKRYKLEVNPEGQWVSPTVVDKNKPIEYFHSMGKVNHYVSLIEETRKQGAGIIEGRVIETKTGNVVKHIPPQEPKKQEEAPVSEMKLEDVKMVKQEEKVEIKTL